MPRSGFTLWPQGREAYGEYPCRHEAQDERDEEHYPQRLYLLEPEPHYLRKYHHEHGVNNICYLYPLLLEVREGRHEYLQQGEYGKRVYHYMLESVVYAQAQGRHKVRYGLDCSPEDGGEYDQQKQAERGLYP